MHNITLIPGDGIGPEITDSVKAVIDAAGVAIKWDLQMAGQKAVELYGDPIPQQLIDSIKKNRIVLKGPLTTHIGSGFKSINVTLRQMFDLYANIRPVKSLQGITSHYEGVDVVIFRENTEDLYAGIENVINEDRVEAIKVITRSACKRIGEKAFDYAAKNHRKKVTAIHKANIMKKSDGLFLEETRKVSQKYNDIKYSEMIVDNACMQLVLQPRNFDVIVTENLYGDIISDLCAGLVGGLGVVPGINLGENHMIFEAVHGSAPDIAGKNVANPLALLLSAVEMLKSIGEHRASALVQAAVDVLLKEKCHLTPDLGGKSTTVEMTNELCRIVNAKKNHI